MIIPSAICLAVIIIICLLASLLLLKIVLYLRKDRKSSKSIAFFHPNCCDGGGGERVFWSFINTILNKVELEKGSKIIIYCGHTDKSCDDIFKIVEVGSTL